MKIHLNRKTLLAALMSAAVFSTALPVQAQTKREIKVSHSAQGVMSSELHMAAWVFSNYVKENSDTLTVRIYPNNALGEERAVYEAMQLGAGASCAVTGTAILNNFSKRVGVIDLPFLWRDYDHMSAALDGKVGQELAADLEKVGFKTVAWMTNWGARNVVTANKSIKTPEDLKGLKIRTIQSPVYIDALNAMGANATPMSFGEVYTSMQTGVLDGFEHGSAIVVTQKFYEVAKHIALTRHFLGPVVLACSMSEWNKLSDKEKAVVLEAGRLASDVNRSLAPLREKEAFDFLRAKGMDITEIDTSVFRERAVASQDKFAADRGAQDLLKQIRDL
ncbi:TRAP transporter substrate-binding protein [Pollutimonas bauzanensis]|uniref:Tripartite ATP-independent transporter solute receptor, DctP family n=1 Tax=Pollutimonas bauzanensis TaxID=658167 RepID=A0A1M5VFJ9_9BURK|nr:TRAP transporter substrate-binding protein [Pollutimonas bauzanensis]SHH74016.1 tripartite ATP-independent transporter solute receptor, DctP family [Pollutimonas bauzanensis]